MRVFVTGGTGLIGSHLVPRLQARNDTVIVLTRRAAAAREKLGPGCEYIEGDPMKAGPWMDAVSTSDAVLNLVGENIFARRWNDESKKLLRDSRVLSTGHVVAALARNPLGAAGKAKVLVSASAIGYYGTHQDEELTEDAAPGNDTLARLCVDWEAAARQAESSGVRVAIVRVGVVLDPREGALAKMMTPIKWFVGGTIGSGKQWVSWIHYRDIVGILLKALDNHDARGPINGTAPQPATNRELTKALGRALHRPTFMPAPGFALRLALGEVATLVTAGQRVLPRRAEELGYIFEFPVLTAALSDLCRVKAA